LLLLEGTVLRKHARYAGPDPGGLHFAGGFRTGWRVMIKDHGEQGRGAGPLNLHLLLFVVGFQQVVSQGLSRSSLGLQHRGDRGSYVSMPGVKAGFQTLPWFILFISLGLQRDELRILN